MVRTYVDLSPLQIARLHYQPQIPKILKEIRSLSLTPGKSQDPISISSEIKQLFPQLSQKEAYLSFTKESKTRCKPLRVGVVFSGGQAAGGHNVITGLFDGLKQMHEESRLFGFLNGPKGIIEDKYVELSADDLAIYRNQGGFDLLGSGRTKIESPQQFEAVEATVRSLNLDGLLIIGGDDSNTNAAFLAEYFLNKRCKVSVVGVPKTIDGDLANGDITIPFGFDSAVRTYSEIIGNIAYDALSAKKYYHFIKLMGRSASHIVLECALRVRPNLALISEEIASRKQTLEEVIQKICDLICVRSEQGKDYGIVLIPEGIIEFIPNLFQALPKELQNQLMQDRDPHGNIQVSKIETDGLIIDMVKSELEQRKKAGIYKGCFNAQGHFCGYEGRSCLPSNFDAQYCYALGLSAAVLINSEITGYICCIRGLDLSVDLWEAGGRNLATMLSIEKRNDKYKPVIAKNLVNLNSDSFLLFKEKKDDRAINDHYCCPGPMQFFGPQDIVEDRSYRLTCNLRGKPL